MPQDPRFTWAEGPALPPAGGDGAFSGAGPTGQDSAADLRSLCFKIFAAVSDAILVANDDRVYVACNPAAAVLLGTPQDRIIGRRIDDFTAKDVRPHVPQAWARFLEAGSDSGDIVLVRPDGGRLVVSYSAMAHVDPGLHVSILRDVTDQRRTERDLEDKVAELQTVLEAVPAMVLVAHDPESRVITGSRSSYEFLGMPPGANLSLTPVPGGQPRPYRLTRQGRDLPVDELPMWRACHGIEMRDFEADLETEDGIVRTIFGNAVPLRRPDGATRGAIAAFVEITDHKRLEQALRDSEARSRAQLHELDTLYRTAPIGLGLFDRDLRFLRINERLAEINGLSVEQHLGRTAYEIVPDLVPLAEPLFRRVFETGEPILGSELRGTTPKAPGVERQWIEDFYPLKGETGAVVAVGVTVLEVTDRKRAERALRDSEERFRASIETMLDAFGIYTAIRDPAGRITDFRIDYVNAAACAANRISREQQLGRGLCELLPAHRRSGLFDLYCRVVETGDSYAGESVFYQDVYGGERLERVFDIRAARLGDGFTAAWRDITERKRAEAELAALLAEKEALLRRQDMLIREVNHRVKNSLQLVSSLLGVQSLHLTDPAARLQFLEAQRRVLTVAKIHEQLYRQTQSPDRIAFGPYLKSLCAHLVEASLQESRDIRVEVAVDQADLPTDQAVPLALIVNELLTNAIKYAFAGAPAGTVTVTFRAGPDGRCSLTVADDGVGLPPGFDPMRSTGLGMKIVTGLVGQLDGDLTADTTAPGTRFTVAWRRGG